MVDMMVVQMVLKMADVMAELKDMKLVYKTVVKWMGFLLDASLELKVLEDYTNLMRQHHLR